MNYDTGLYVLDKDHNVIACPDVKEWGKKLRMNNRFVEQSAVRDKITQDILGTLSTVFLGIDHQYGDGPPLVFETMFFSHETEERPLRRYNTWDEAHKGHAEWKTLLEHGTPIDELPI
jgi:hypothetical protein